MLGKSSQKVVVWRQFARKSYSAFASLHRVICIGVLSVATLSVAAKADAQKGASSSKSSQVEPSVLSPTEEGSSDLTEVTVSGTMAPLTQLQAARFVCVLTRQDIEQAAAQSVNDLLKLVTGVDLIQPWEPSDLYISSPNLLLQLASWIPTPL